ncbi:MAG: GrdX family protein [Firmicutes bacterium]|nr:GrdX family protein [Dethiobacter sp.]MBS3887975.1 GrdX family protein [Bacillota bacterium]MBS4055236.1 GrdX family protein [Thermaerobacter sp.]
MPYSIVVSNNPTLEYRATDICLKSPDNLAVLETVRDYVHLGHHLLTHPFAGSVKPNENPFRSIVITYQAFGVDYQSVQLVEGCLSVARRMLAERPLRDYSPSVLCDLASIDKSLCDAGLMSLRLAGHY